MTLGTYQTEDLKQIAELFYHTVHSINCMDYSPEQLNAWADGRINFEQWNNSLLEHYSIVAEKDGRIVGFGDIAKTNDLDRLYVHKDFQRQQIASAICDELERQAAGTITVHASITARPFFEKRGYRVIAKQQVLRKNVFLTNYRMEKEIKNRTVIPLISERDVIK